LDLEIIAAGLQPSNFISATLPMPPSPPSPTPVPSPPVVHSPSPPPITVLGADEPTSVPTPSPPPAPLGKKQAKTRGKRVHSPGLFKRGATQPEGQKPPTIQIPSARARSSTGQDSSQHLRSFPSEGFRPTGVVVRTLFPPCKHCNNNRRLCSLEAGQPLAAKIPRCCSPCKVAHIS
jgi:hypothetical protein